MIPKLTWLLKDCNKSFGTYNLAAGNYKEIYHGKSCQYIIKSIISE